MLVVGGLAVSISASINGYDGFGTGFVDGAATLRWPSTKGATYSVKISSARLWWWPNHQVLDRPYYYKVNGTAYSSARYDVHGPFVGSEQDIARYYLDYPPPEVTVYYNPSNPSEAVIKPGISFDRMTKLYMIFAVGGFAMAFLGAWGIWRSVRSTAHADPPIPGANGGTTDEQLPK